MGLQELQEKCLAEGRIKELNFAKALEKFVDNDSISMSTKEEDMSEHWDVKIEFKIDVKGIKNINMTDNNPNDNIHWVEIKNVKGKPGWLYGKANQFAFETQNMWVVVDKIKLQEFIAIKLAGHPKSDKPELYKLYRRKDRLDYITMVRTLDLIGLPKTILIPKVDE